MNTIFPGILDIFRYFGEGIGTTGTGWLFREFGPRITLFASAIFTFIVLLLFVVFIFGSKNLDDHERINESEEEDNFE